MPSPRDCVGGSLHTRRSCRVRRIRAGIRRGRREGRLLRNVRDPSELSEPVPRDARQRGKQMRSVAGHAECSFDSASLIRLRHAPGPRTHRDQGRAPRVVGCLQGDDAFVNQAPEHAADVAFHGGTERMPGKVVHPLVQLEEPAGLAARWLRISSL